MFYLSPTLTMLMLTVVPPVSLGAVRPRLLSFLSFMLTNQQSVLLRPLPQTPLQPHPRSRRRDDQNRLRSPRSIPHRPSLQRPTPRISKIRHQGKRRPSPCAPRGASERGVPRRDGVEWERHDACAAWVWRELGVAGSDFGGGFDEFAFVYGVCGEWA